MAYAQLGAYTDVVQMLQAAEEVDILKLQEGHEEALRLKDEEIARLQAEHKEALAKKDDIIRQKDKEIVRLMHGRAQER